MTQNLKINVSDDIYQYLQEVAGITQLSLEQLVRQSLEGNLPPRMTDAPSEMQAELVKLQLSATQELCQIAESQMSAGQQSRHFDLLEKNRRNKLTADERNELAALRIAADRLMVRKAYLYALAQVLKQDWLPE